MLFKYRALKDNKVVSGIFEGLNREEVALYLKSNNFIPLEIREAKSNRLTILNLLDRVNFQDISQYTRQLAMMLNAGLTLVDSIEILKKQTNKPSFRELLDQIGKEVSAGKSYSQTLEKYPHLFSRLYIALVRAGEASGKLDTIMLRIADNMEKQKAFQAKVKSALIYPAIIIAAGLVLVFVLITFVLPGLTEVYKNFDVELPASTKFIMGMSDFLGRTWPIILILIIAAVVGIRRFLQTPIGIRLIDTFLMNAPVVNSLLKMSNLVDATRTFSVLIGSGVSILDSLSISSEATSNILFRDALKEVYRQVEKGVALGDALANQQIFPITLVQMAMVGEQTGRLEETMRKISEYYQMESETALKTFTTLIEPMILVVLGIIVGFLVMSILTPIYSLTQSLSK